MNLQRKTDYVAQWFRVYRALGEKTDIKFKYKNKPSIESSEFSEEENTAHRLRAKFCNPNEFQNYKYSHEKGDGSCGISSMAKDLGFEAHNLRTDHFRRPPGLIKFLLLQLEFLWRTRFLKASIWKTSRQNQYIDQTEDHFALGSIVWGPIRLPNKEFEKTWNALLFATLDRSIRPYLVPQADPVRWWIPVNMRNDLGVSNSDTREFNFVSNFTLISSPELTVETAHKLIVESLARQRHWATWWWQNLGRWIPEHWLQKVAQIHLVNSHYAGAFSNLGRWSCSQKDLQVHFLVNTLKSHPIGAGAIWWNNQVNISLHIHPSLGFSKEETEQIMLAWIENINSILEQIE